MLSKFESDYETNEQIITVLLKDKCNGAIVFEKEYLKPSVTFVAAIYEGTDEVVKEDGRIEWLIKKENRSAGFGHDFKQYGIYKLLVRKSIQKELSPMQMPVMNNRYMLVKVIEENVEEENLLSIKEYLSKPVIIESEFGDFVLNRSMSWFESKVYLDDSTLNVYLETDKDNDDTANNAIETFISIANNFNEFDMKNKEAAANFLLEFANDWLADYDSENKPEEITKQMFMDAIEISEVTISPDGSMTVYYDDGNLFWGHVIEMYIESDGSCSDAHIAG